MPSKENDVDDSDEAEDKMDALSNDLVVAGNNWNVLRMSSGS